MIWLKNLRKFTKDLETIVYKKNLVPLLTLRSRISKEKQLLDC